MTRLAPAISQRLDPVVNQSVLGCVNLGLNLTKRVLQVRMIAVERRDAVPAILADEEMLFNLAQLGFEQAGERVKLQRVDHGMEGFQTYSFTWWTTFIHRALYCRQVAALTRAELIEELSRAAEVPVQQAADIIQAMFDSMVRALRCGDRIEIRGFGSFATRQRRARRARNPKTGAEVDVPPKKIPYFRPSKEVRELVNKSKATQDLLEGAPETKRSPV
jgi:integration host factor subunit beta